MEYEELPAATFGQAWESFRSQLFVFSRRSTRAEYWWIVLLGVSVNSALEVIKFMLGAVAPESVTSAFSVLAYLASFVMFVLLLGLTVRRFHDAGFATWVFVVTLVLPAVLFLFGAMLMAALVLFDLINGVLFDDGMVESGLVVAAVPWLAGLAIYVFAFAVTLTRSKPDNQWGPQRAGRLHDRGRALTPLSDEA